MQSCLRVFFGNFLSQTFPGWKNTCGNCTCDGQFVRAQVADGKIAYGVIIPENLQSYEL